MTDIPQDQQAEGTIEEMESIVIRFAGDSGDGMQLTGTQFTNTAAVFGNDISTLPDFPAEIRAPAGTLAGVSGFQVNLSSQEIHTPGDAPQVLVAMNPAALAANIADLERGGVVIVNTDAFTKSNLKKANLETNPLEDGSLDSYKLHEIPLTTLNRNALEEFSGDLSSKDIDRCKNFFALGLVFWMFDRPLEITNDWIDGKFGKRLPVVARANQKALQSGYFLGETTETFQSRYRVAPAQLKPGTYRKITGNQAVAIGLVTAAYRSGKPLVYCGYPITPASDILHYLAPLKHFDVRTFQAEDEIAAMGAALGSAFGGGFTVTATSGPGIALKSEALNLAMICELPMVVINVQRGGPSTGLPTKPEQGDLLQVMYGRNGESPLPVIAPATPSDAFWAAIDAFRMAVRAMTPVILLSDGYLANSSEPWNIPDPDTVEPIEWEHPTEIAEGEAFKPFVRDIVTLARPWALPGTPGFEHRLGGLAKAPETGNVSYNPEHQSLMVADRAEKIQRLQEIIPPREVYGAQRGDVLVLSWGSTYGAARSAVQRAIKGGMKGIGHVHLRYLNPLPKDLDDIITRYDTVLVPELNSGQLAGILRGKYGSDHIIAFPKVKGRPFTIGEILTRINELN
ncbi:MAG: 2-oxoacid:acceptor oxidoreductase subunit alpha [Chloroflexota bacterium]